ncbi:tetratricopeptide repeat protein [Dolichospermum flos-aquae UHCC 0037]|uniref:Tetratricopeptide repeat protein n=1 Tax=Dolichospermum flos-aquae UHCC 0037 TaxID=2590026 RepID=A0ACC7S934_DOLFA|nr:tetratricopeptide repeat protein [Dolichospermum flos-aquae UHCC 0037]
MDSSDGKRTKLTPTKDIPYRGSVHFVGRETELTTIHEDLRRGNYVAITGMGGLGKTELVTQYATQYQDHYDGIIWFNARQRFLAAEVFELFTLKFGLEIPQTQGEKPLTLKQQVDWCWLQYPKTQKPVLIVIDDLTDLTQLQDVVPLETRFRVLITTRQQHLDPNHIQELPLEILSPPIALELLQKQLGGNHQRFVNELETATEICEFLGNLPLGIILVGSYLKTDLGLSLTQMLERLQKRKLAETALQKRETINQTQLGIKAAFNLTWETLDTQTQYLGAFLSLFSPQFIFWDLVVWVIEFEVENEEKQLIWTEEELTTSKKRLYQVNFLQTGQESPEAYTIHNLVRLFLQEQLAEVGEKQPILERNFITPMIFVAERLPQSPTSEDIENFQLVVVHWEDLGKRLIDEINQETVAENNLPVSMVADEICWVFEGLGRFYQGQGLYQVAEFWYQQLVKVCQIVFTNDHPYVATSLNNLAGLYRNQGKYSEAEPLYLDALEMTKRLFTGDHPYVASSLNNLALLYDNQGKYSEAEPLYLEALEMTKRLFTGDHPNVATSLNNLASLYNNQGKYSEAEPLYLEALEMTKRLFTGDHPDVATSLNNLAYLYKSQGKYSEVEPLYLEALEMTKRLFTGDYPDVAQILNNLAVFYDNQGKYSEAEPLYFEALKMTKRLFTGDHPNVANSLNNLAVFYDDQGKYSEAEPLYFEALEMRKQLFTGDHPDVANSLNNLAFLYKSQGRYSEAEPLYLDALEMTRRLFTGDHPDVASSLNNLAFLYKSQGRYSEAEPLYLDALEMTRRLFTGDHPDVASSLNNLAGLYRNQGKYSEAELLYLDALAMSERVQGTNHPNTITVRNNLQFLQQQLIPLPFYKRLLNNLLVVLTLLLHRLRLLIKRIIIFSWRLFRQ